MPTPALPDAKIQAIKSMLESKPRKTHAAIAEKLKVSVGTVANVRHGRLGEPASVSEPIAYDGIRRVLKKGSKTVEEMADALDCSPKKVRELLAEMNGKGAMLIERDGLWDVKDSAILEPGTAVLATKPGMRRYGALGDNHLCNRHSRLDVLTAAYDSFERLGITDVFNTGNWIDGEMRFNKTELVTRPGMDAQIDYMIDNYPVRKGITTHYIAGDDHEGWYQQREGIEIGRYLQMRAQEAGRTDLMYLGYGECDVKLAAGKGAATLRVVHPGGGSAYAISYTDQKRVESYQGGEKPQIELAGHYHKFNYGYPREVHTLQTGCTCDQTMFMRKKRLQAHVGYSVIEVTQDASGAVTQFGVDWFPFFDRACYEKRF